MSPDPRDRRPSVDRRDGTDPSSPIVVLVHGAMDRASSWDKVRRRLTDCTTIAYDRRGYAGSVHLDVGADPFAAHVADLHAVLATAEASDPGRPVVLVGHSAGSNIVLAVSSRRTDIIGPGESAANVRAAVVFEPPMPWCEWWPGSAGGSTLTVAREHGAEAAAEAFMRRIVGDSIWERLPESTRTSRRAEGAALVADLATLRDRPVQFDHRAVSIPVVVGRGERSIPHHRRASEETAALLAHPQLEDLAGHAHGAHTTDPDGFASLIRRAIASM